MWFGLIVFILIGLHSVTARAVVAPDFKLGAASEDASRLPAFETDIGRKSNVFLIYQAIGNSLDTATLAPIAKGGRMIELAWEPWDPAAADPVNQPAYQLRDITAGKWDADIHRWAQQIRDFGYPVLFRPMSEMNGDWTSWGGTVNGNVPGDFIPAWRHIHDIFVSEKAANASFDWSPNRDGDSVSAAATFQTYYPGDSYVDYMGINGYNWGTMYNTPAWTSTWQSFTEVFGYSYDAFTERSPKPVFISETASTELGGDKAAWIKDAFDVLPVRFPRVAGLVWFNNVKETDWRVESSPASLAAFKAAVVISNTSPPTAPAPVIFTGPGAVGTSATATRAGAPPGARLAAGEVAPSLPHRPAILPTALQNAISAPPGNGMRLALPRGGMRLGLPNDGPRPASPTAEGSSLSNYFFLRTALFFPMIRDWSAWACERAVDATHASRQAFEDILEELRSGQVLPAA